MSSTRRVILVGLVMLLSALAVPCATADADDGSDDGYPLILVSEDYHIWVLESYAVTEVVRVFENPTPEPVDHVFDFLIPQGALLSNFSLMVDGKTYYAQVLERAEAEERYQQAVANGSTAGLVASYGDDHFCYRVSFAPGEAMTATVRYEQVLLKANGWQTLDLLIASTSNLTLPLAFSVEASVSAPEDIEVLQTLGYDEDTDVSFTSKRDALVTVTVEDMSDREDIEIRWRTGYGNEVGKMYFHERAGVGYFVHVFDPDPGFYGPSPISKDFVFVMDKSGSMSGLKFAQSRVAMNYTYSHLSLGDRFSFVEFNSGFTTYSDELIPATGSNKAAIVQHIMSLSAGGSTDIHSAVIEALNIFKAAGDTMPVIVLLSDGLANSGLYHRSQFRQAVLSQNTVDASIFCIALGNGADWNFLEALAIENDGRAIWVHESEDVIRVIRDFVASFSNAILADLSFEYGPNVWDVHPDQVRAYYEGSEVLVTGRISMESNDVHCKVIARSPEGDVVSEGLFPVEMVPGNDFVPRFWAYKRIKDLEDSMKVDGPDNDTISEIVDLAIEFHFATDHTSLFVELPNELNQRFYGDEEPVQPYLGPSPDADADSFSGLYSPGAMKSGSPQRTSTLSYAFSGSILLDGVGGYDPSTLELGVLNYTEWKPGEDIGTTFQEPCWPHQEPWRPGDPQASDPLGTDSRVQGTTASWAYWALATLCITAVAIPLVLRPTRRGGEP